MTSPHPFAQLNARLTALETQLQEDHHGDIRRHLQTLDRLIAPVQEVTLPLGDDAAGLEALLETLCHEEEP